MPDEPITAAPDAGTADPAAAVADATPWHEGLIEKDAAGAEKLRNYADWKENAPPLLREFIDANMTAARQKTEGMLKVPGEAAPPEEWDAFYRGLGRPDKPEDYGLKAPEKMPDGVSWDEAAAAKFLPLAHQLGLTSKQVAALSEFQISSVAENAAAVKAETAKAIAAEKAEAKTMFGETFADTCLIAQQAANKLGIPKEAFDPTSGNYWGNAALKVVATLARENAKLKMEDRGTNLGASPATGGRQWAEDVIKNKDNPDHAKYMAGDVATVKRVTENFRTQAA